MNALKLIMAIFDNDGGCLRNFLKDKTAKEAWESKRLDASHRMMFIREFDELWGSSVLQDKLKHIPAGKKKVDCHKTCWCAGNGPDTGPGRNTIRRLISFDKDIEPRLKKVCLKADATIGKVRREREKRKAAEVREEERKILKERRDKEREKREEIAMRIREKKRNEYRKKILIKRLPGFGPGRIYTLWHSIYR